MVRLGCIVVLSAICLVHRVHGNGDLHETVKSLQAQVTSLLVAKEQQTLLITQLKELRDEVVLLRDKCRGLRNLSTKTKWLEASLSEARGQVSELGAALDRSETSIGTLRNQVQANARDIAKVSATKDSRRFNEVLWANEVYKEPDDKKTRHHRIIRKRIENLETSTKEVWAVQKQLQAQVEKLSENQSEVYNSTSVDKVHASMLELLESVEALETKVDNNLPTVQKEISRTELSLGELIQQTAVIKEEQDNQKLSLKALGVGLSTVQDKLSSLSSNTSYRTLQKSDADGDDMVRRLGNIITEYQQVVEALPQDCTGVTGKKVEMLNLGSRPRLVSCEDGWTIVQKRKDGSVQFNRNWEEYAQGFGNPQGEFWIGNEALHALTKNNNSRLRVDMVDIYGHLWSAEYESFRVGDRQSGFKLTTSGYRGNASDALDYQNGMQFSAKDSDRDISNTHCAANYEGGWWFSHCQHANLNGRYNLGLTWFHAVKNEWIAVAESTMKLSSN